MPIWIKSVIITIVSTAIIGPASWGIVKASKNSEEIVKLKTCIEEAKEAKEKIETNQDVIFTVRTEYKILSQTLERIEHNIAQIRKQQEEFDKKINRLTTAHALTHQKLLDHISYQTRRR